MWKKVLLFLLVVLVGCNQVPTTTSPKSVDFRPNIKEDVEPILLDELRLGFSFFYFLANGDENSPGYGLIPDRYNIKNDKAGDVASIASVGFGLSTLPIGIEYDWISYEDGYNRALKTLYTLDKMDRVHGFYYHFVNMKTAKRVWNCEVSIIDTAILINGVLIVGKYFGGEIENLAYKLYKEIEWNWYFNESIVRFYMGYHPESGFEGSWIGYAEQLMIYVLASGSPTYNVDKSAYINMILSSKKASQNDAYDPFYLTHTGSLFTYQFSHAWIDFKDIEDERGINWFLNSKNATLSAIEYGKASMSKYKTFNENAWGLTASDGPNGYSGLYGNRPNSGNVNLNDGTIPLCGALGSLPFTPQQVIEAAKHYRLNEKLWSKYGFIDSYNLGVAEGHIDKSIENKIPLNGWYASDIIGIDKGISVLMIENYISGFIWNIFKEIEYIQNGLDNLGFKKV